MMKLKLQHNSVQKIRLLLDRIRIPVSPFAGASDAVRVLLDEVKEKKGDPEFRSLMHELLSDIETGAFDGLPVKECEQLDASALADELEWVLQPKQQGPGFAMQRSIAALFAAASLMIGTTLAVSCADESETSSESVSCADDTSSGHFTDLAKKGEGLDEYEIDNATDKYSQLSNNEKEDVIAQMCGMSPDDIAQFIEDVSKGSADLEDAGNYSDNEGNSDGGNNNGDIDYEDDDDYWTDDDVTYKGVKV